VKIAAGFVAVLIALLGMIAAIGHLDGSIVFGEPPAVVAPVDDDSPMTGVEEAYLQFVIGVLQTTSTDIYTLGTLFSNPAMEDEYWQASVTVLLNRIEAAHGSIVLLEPTARLQPFQDAAVVALDHSGEFVKILRGSLVQGETELTEEAATELMAAAEAFGQAEGLLNEFLASHQAPE
jgi:hypothetical protein